MVRSSIWTTTDLILANTRYGEGEKILIMSAESIDLVEAIANIVAHVHVHDTSYQHLNNLRVALRQDNVTIADTPFPSGKRLFDAAILFVPKGREFARANLWAAAHAVKIDGELYIAGPNDGGAKTMIKDAATLLGDCNLVAYKKSHRIARAIIPSTITLPADWSDVTTSQKFSVETSFGNVTVVSQPGVFSWNAVDDGTRYLLENLRLHAADHVLDLGCGNGIIGASIAPHVAHITLTDDNLLAIDCARQTITQNQINNATVLASDGYSELSDQQFDLIVCNPPFHQKFDTTTQITDRIIREAPAHLKRGGKLVIVANSFLKYEPLFLETFKQTRIIAQNNRYKIIEGTV